MGSAAAGVCACVGACVEEREGAGGKGQRIVPHAHRSHSAGDLLGRWPGSTSTTTRTTEHNHVLLPQLLPLLLLLLPLSADPLQLQLPLHR